MFVTVRKVIVYCIIRKKAMGYTNLQIVNAGAKVVVVVGTRVVVW